MLDGLALRVSRTSKAMAGRRLDQWGERCLLGDGTSGGDSDFPRINVLPGASSHIRAVSTLTDYLWRAASGISPVNLVG